MFGGVIRSGLGGSGTGIGTGTGTSHGAGGIWMLTYCIAAVDHAFVAGAEGCEGVYCPCSRGTGLTGFGTVGICQAKDRGSAVHQGGDDERMMLMLMMVAAAAVLVENFEAPYAAVEAELGLECGAKGELGGVELVDADEFVVAACDEGSERIDGRKR